MTRFTSLAIIIVLSYTALGIRASGGLIFGTMV